MFEHDHFLHLVEFIFAVSDAPLQELGLLVQLPDVLLQPLVVLFKLVEIFLQIDSHLSFLEDLESADINLFHKAQLLLLV